MISIKIYPKPKGTASPVPTTASRGGVAIGGKSVLDAEHARRADVADVAERARLADTARHATTADTATRAEIAHDVDSDSPLYDHVLRKDKPDRTKYPVTFEQGINGGDFVQGSKGAAMWRDSEGNWHIEGDYLEARRKLTAKEVEIMRTSHVGGRVMLSPASATITNVVELASVGWFCYFPKKDADGVERALDFRIGDQVICQTFNLQKSGNKVGNHFWWRLVTFVGQKGDDYWIQVSATAQAEGSDEPLVGDRVVVLGHRFDDASRQNAIILGGAGTGSPFIRSYKGINSFTLPEPVAQISPEKSWIKVNDGKGHEVKIDDALQGINDTLGVVKEQNDEQLVLWFGEGKPTLDNYPASDWKNEAVRREHIKDIYYDRSNKTGGRAYSFEQLEGRWVWNNITDKDVLASLEKAEKAQDTADGKRRTFVAEPQPPYDVGDLWVNANYPQYVIDLKDRMYNNDLLRCVNSKKSGESFAISDWKPAQALTTRTFESKIEQTSKTIDLTIKEVESNLEKAGVHLDGENSKITLNAKTTEVSDDLVVKRLETKPTTGQARVSIAGSEMEIYGSHGQRNIKFGVDSDGNAVLQYFDNNGLKLYDLGPRGMNWVEVNSERFDSVGYHVRLGGISATPDHSESTSGAVALYQYVPKRINGVVYGGAYSNHNADIAKRANGRIYTRKDIYIGNTYKEDYEANGLYRSTESKIGTIASVAKWGFSDLDEVKGFLLDKGVSLSLVESFDYQPNPFAPLPTLWRPIHWQNYVIYEHGLGRVLVDAWQDQLPTP